MRMESKKQDDEEEEEDSDLFAIRRKKFHKYTREGEWESERMDRMTTNENGRMRGIVQCKLWKVVVTHCQFEDQHEYFKH